MRAIVAKAVPPSSTSTTTPARWPFRLKPYSPKRSHRSGRRMAEGRGAVQFGAGSSSSVDTNHDGIAGWKRVFRGLGGGVEHGRLDPTGRRKRQLGLERHWLAVGGQRIGLKNAGGVQPGAASGFRGWSHGRLEWCRHRDQPAGQQARQLLADPAQLRPGLTLQDRFSPAADSAAVSTVSTPPAVRFRRRGALASSRSLGAAPVAPRHASTTV